MIFKSHLRWFFPLAHLLIPKLLFKEHRASIPDNLFICFQKPFVTMVELRCELAIFCPGTSPFSAVVDLPPPPLIRLVKKYVQSLVSSLRSPPLPSSPLEGTHLERVPRDWQPFRLPDSTG